MKKYLYLFICICFCLTTCKKEVSIYSRNDYLKIGMDTNVLITKYDSTLIGGYNNLLSLDIDINGDDVPDFRFTSEIWGSPAIGQHPRAKIICLNSNSFLCGKIITDTNFMHKMIVTSTISDSITEIDNYKLFSYCRTDSSDSIANILLNQFKIATKNKGDCLYKTDLFRTDTCIMYDDWYSYIDNVVNNNNEVIYNHITIDNTCYNFTLNKIYYIGIKIKDLKSERLGWLKFSISDGYKILFYESAIQK